MAWEECLMESVRGPVLMLWQSDGAVVMGKNQNPWRECRLALMEAEGVALALVAAGEKRKCFLLFPCIASSLTRRH